MPSDLEKTLGEVALAAFVTSAATRPTSLSRGARGGLRLLLTGPSARARVQFPEKLEDRVNLLADVSVTDIAQRYRMQNVLGSGAPIHLRAAHSLPRRLGGRIWHSGAHLHPTDSAIGHAPLAHRRVCARRPARAASERSGAPCTAASASAPSSGRRPCACPCPAPPSGRRWADRLAASRAAWADRLTATSVAAAWSGLA